MADDGVANSGDKIRPCVNYARSSKPRDVAAAMRHAQGLLCAHFASRATGFQVAERWARSAAAARPLRHEVGLASLVAETFGCRMLFTRRANQAYTKIAFGYTFLGAAPAPDLAWTAFTQLSRRLSAMRRTRAARLRGAQRTKGRSALADAFCAHWVLSVRQFIGERACGVVASDKVAEYLRVHYAVGKTARLGAHARLSKDGAETGISRHASPLTTGSRASG